MVFKHIDIAIFKNIKYLMQRSFVMNYLYVSAGTVFTLIFLAQMLAFAAFTKKKTVYSKK